MTTSRRKEPEVEVTNPDRVLFPEVSVTKGDVVAHYRRVAPRMLPHVIDRPLTLVRHPRGVDQKGFWQKNVAKHYPEELIGRIEMPRSNGVTVHASVSSAEGLAYLANQGTVELHVSLATRVGASTGSEPASAESFRLRQDRLVLDLDPEEGGAAKARDAARACRALLDELGVATTPVATGSKGYHVTARIEPAASITRTAHQLAAILVRRHPDLLTHEVLKEKREGRVLVDWMRNAPLATVVAPWSLRARPRATVAMPIPWDELDETAPDAFTIHDDLDRQDPLLELSPFDPEPLRRTVDEIVDAESIELVYFDRFGRRREIEYDE